MILLHDKGQWFDFPDNILIFNNISKLKKEIEARNKIIADFEKGE